MDVLWGEQMKFLSTIFFPVLIGHCGCFDFGYATRIRKMLLKTPNYSQKKVYVVAVWNRIVNLEMDWHPIQGGGVIFLVAHALETGKSSGSWATSLEHKLYPLLQSVCRKNTFSFHRNDIFL